MRPTSFIFSGRARPSTPPRYSTPSRTGSGQEEDPRVPAVRVEAFCAQTNAIQSSGQEKGMKKERKEPTYGPSAASMEPSHESASAVLLVVFILRALEQPGPARYHFPSQLALDPPKYTPPITRLPHSPKEPAPATRTYYLIRDESVGPMVRRRFIPYVPRPPLLHQTRYSLNRRGNPAPRVSDFRQRLITLPIGRLQFYRHGRRSDV